MHPLHKLSQNSRLYDSRFEHDNCGWGLIAHMDGKPSHFIVDTAIHALSRLAHRGGVGADGLSGDGCGLLLSLPKAFLQQAAAESGINLTTLFAAGNVFVSHDEEKAAQMRAAVSDAISARGLSVAGWRVIPTDPSVCGEAALAEMPRIEQLFINAAPSMDDEEFNRHLFVARRYAEKALAAQSEFYICSLSAAVLLYKGMVIPSNLAAFYPDLCAPNMTASIAVFHQRFSTNTMPQWRLAQPFRMLAHNGEINTIQGNRNWARARVHKLKSPLLPELAELTPIVALNGSDSMSLDNMLELLITGGMDLFQAMRMLVPPAWQNVDQMDPDLRAFLEFNSIHMEPWDGPAGIVLTDGRYAACTMDRNGLRPARYVITDDRHITLASEIGVWDYDAQSVVQKGRLKPGQMLAIDTHTGTLLMPEEIDNQLKNRHPYARWLRANARHLRSRMRDTHGHCEPIKGAQLQTYEKLFDVTFEERDQVLRVAAEDGQEAVGSMGDDTPFPVMSLQVRSVFDNFRQQFAQVTNPPIDPLRESIVMSLETSLGCETNLFYQNERSAKRLKIRSPILSREKFATLMAMSDEPELRSEKLSLWFDPQQCTLHQAIQTLTQTAEAAARQGITLIVLSDRTRPPGQVAIHAALATGAVQQHLINTGLRCSANIIVETGTARDSHQMAVLIGYGATCVYPYLAYSVLHDLVDSAQIKSVNINKLEQNYRQGLNKGLLKIMSKMGISTIASYRAAQLFEIVGLADEVVDLCFSNTVSRVQGADFAALQEDTCALAARADDPKAARNQGGLLKFIHGGEYHAYNPDVVQTLQSAVNSGDWAEYRRYADLSDQRTPSMLRDLLSLKTQTPISLDEVESADDIVRRFDSAGMSLGALSPEAHETLAEAMNRLGARSNSGEGGEDPERFDSPRVSKIKQIASGRFGVTPHYLVNAEVLQIKVAQGAKPGEGGQLPGHKVNALIARLRHSTPGVSLISPPPHHDIYSIEDLAQLIYDLKQVNPDALVSVKLVSEPGVGTVAAGVAKAYADLITISGYDGGTGASPLTSVKYAGSPWELGLAETHQVLRANGLRGMVRVQCDGGLKTGLDVIKAAILGAESFGFGTGPMISMGCKFLRICHLNNCATGVATQNHILRKRHFHGNVEKVVNYMRFIAEDVRQHMAALGVRKMTDLIGRNDLLGLQTGVTDKQRGLDLSPLIDDAGLPADLPQFCQIARNKPWDQGTLAAQMLEDCRHNIETKTAASFSYDIRNIDRSVGASLSGAVAKLYGNEGMKDAPLNIHLSGTAGQSFGVWNAGGVHLTLEGDANDYVGKGMAGGELVLRPPRGSRLDTRSTTIMGNTCLYGATGGRLFAAGLAGERFGVRNSGCEAVVEGLGDHGCEYMTGGCVVSLGETGVNFGAGMTGGIAFVLDLERTFVDRYNHELIDTHRLRAEAMEPYRHYLSDLLEAYTQATGSAWGREVFGNFYRYIPHFWLIKPRALEMDQLFATLKRAA